MSLDAALEAAPHDAALEARLRSLSIDRSGVSAAACAPGAGAARRWRLWVALILGLLAVPGAAGLWSVSGGGWLSGLPAGPAQAALQAPVPSAPVASTPVAAPPLVVGSGHVIALHELVVGARITGTVARISVDSGQRVAAGQELIALDASDALLALQVAEAQAGMAAAAVASARAGLRAAEAPVRRQGVLVARGASDAAGLEDAQLALARLEQGVVLALREQQVAALRIAQARSLVGQHVIRAPFDAIVVGPLAAPGQVIVEMGQGSPEETTLMRLIDTSALFVDVDVAERNVAQIRPDMPAEVRLDAWPDRSLRARVHAITPRASREKATVSVRLKLDPADVGGALVNMAAKVTFGRDAQTELSDLN